MSEEAAKFPIRTVSALTGVPSITLRAWERRHRLIAPRRTDGGHRLYTQADIDRVHRIVSLMSDGIPVGRVGEAMREETSTGEAGPEAAVVSAWQRWREQLLAGVATFDEPRIDALYQEMLALHPAERVMAEALLPALATLGERWKASPVAIAEEHFFAAFIRNKLGARLHHRSRSVSGPRLLLACLPGEHHEAGLLLFALAAHDRGYRLALLGPDMPIEPLPAASRRAQADAIVLSGSVRPIDAPLCQAIAALVADAGRPVFVGGLSSLVARDALVQTGAEVLGIELDAAMDRIGRRLAEDRHGDVAAHGVRASQSLQSNRLPRA